MDYSVSNDSSLSKMVDVLVILILGVAIGVVFSQAVLIQETVTITTSTEVLSHDPDSVIADSPYGVDLPSGAKLEVN